MTDLKLWLCVIILAKSTRFVFGSQLKIGMIAVVDDPTSWMTLMHTGSAINIAYDALVEDGILTNDSKLSIIMRDTTNQSTGVGNVVDLVMNEDVDVIFGSPSSRVTIPAAHLTSHWNFPHITWGANSYELSDKRLFSTLVRTMGPLSEAGSAIVTFFKAFSWNKIGMLYIDYGVCLYSASGVKDEFAKVNITIMQSIAYPPNMVLTTAVIDGYLTLIKQTSRVIFICVDAQLRRFIVRACMFGMCNGEFIFIYTTLSKPKESEWALGDGDDHYAKLGYRYLIWITNTDWYGNDGEQNLNTFNVDVIEKMSEPPWNNNYAKINNISASTSAQYLYDAMYFYGLWLNHSKTVGIDSKNGKAMMAYSRGISFDGISGPCNIGDNGDRIPYFWFYEFLGPEAKAIIVAIAKTKEKVITGVPGFSWLTADGKPPRDSPVCGFFNELCVVEVKDNSVIVVVSCVSVLAVVAVATVISYTIRKRQIENIMMKGVWKVNINEIELQKSKAGIGSRMNFNRTAISQSNISTDSQLSNTKALFTTVGILNGQMICVRTIKKQNQSLTRDDLIQLKTMREMVNDKINPFIGACFDTPSPCVIFIYCPKGSLQDILENDDITLDTTFKQSLMMDLIYGIHFIHQSKLGSHGRLKCMNCLVDNRWVLKITDYGLGTFLDNVVVENIEENQKYKSLLWTAPELLVDTRFKPNGTKEGDIYSFSIIVHEIFYRMGPFAGKAHMTAKDIIGRVRNRERTPCRPEIYLDMVDVAPSVVKLMQLCWSDCEEDRPTANVIKSYIKKNIPGITTNIMDIVLQRLEKYANNLEDLVDQRTQQLMQEKQKTDRLLYRMLPPSCADKLKLGETIEPEIFESVTIFFSDIVGFTTISSKSSPIEVVDFLNDLYTCFDDIISQHDAYKVETIGDAYLVVSGIPKRNGDLHSGIIAGMSLDIRDGVEKFKIKHMPQENLKVRIGMHTGACCAGVVGLSMPRYCLFGDTVNTASRMESNGESQKIHISEATHRALHELGGFHTTFRGEIPVKGKGMMNTFWLVGMVGHSPNTLVE